jgi:hypothetical protein
MRCREMGNFMKKIMLSIAATTLAAGSAFAAGPDLTTLTTAVDFSTVTAGVLLVGAAIIGVYLAYKGVKIVVSAVRGA